MAASNPTNSHANRISPLEICPLPGPAKFPPHCHHLMRLRCRDGCLQKGFKNQTLMVAALAGYLRSQSQTSLDIARVTSAQCLRSLETASTPTPNPSNRKKIRHYIAIGKRDKTVDTNHITHRCSRMTLNLTGRSPSGIICHEWMRRSNPRLCLKIISPFPGHSRQIPLSHV